jgi:hypothetical protein
MRVWWLTTAEIICPPGSSCETAERGQLSERARKTDSVHGWLKGPRATGGYASPRAMQAGKDWMVQAGVLSRTMKLSIFQCAGPPIEEVSRRPSRRAAFQPTRADPCGQPAPRLARLTGLEEAICSSAAAYRLCSSQGPSSGWEGPSSPPAAVESDARSVRVRRA